MKTPKVCDSPDKIPLKSSLIVELETELARNTFHDFCLANLKSPSNGITLAFRVGVCEMKWLILQPDAFTHFHRLGNPKEN